MEQKDRNENNEQNERKEKESEKSISYYEILNISKDATEQEIKTSYHQKVKQYHPDHNIGREKESSEQFNKILEAYRTLCDPKLRANYDRSEILKPHIIPLHSKTEFDKILKENGIRDHNLVVPPFPKKHNVDINPELLNNLCKLQSNINNSVNNATSKVDINQSILNSLPHSLNYTSIMKSLHSNISNNNIVLDDKNSSSSSSSSTTMGGISLPPNYLGVSAVPFKLRKTRSQNNYQHVHGSTKDEKIMKDFIDLLNSSIRENKSAPQMSSTSSSLSSSPSSSSSSSSPPSSSMNSPPHSISMLPDHIIKKRGNNFVNINLSNLSNMNSSGSVNSFGSMNSFGTFQSQSSFYSEEDNEKIKLTTQTSISVSFDESVHGVSKHILFQKQVPCSCVLSNMDDKMEELCNKCDSKGTIREERRLVIEVPAGVYSGWKKVIKDEGDATVSHKGDLIVVFNVENHPFFRRERNNQIDVRCDLPLSFPQACLGVSLQIPSLYGPIRVDIPAGTEHGMNMRIKEYGFPSLANCNSKGDMIVNISIIVPKNLSEQQKKLLLDFDQSTKS